MGQLQLKQLSSLSKVAPNRIYNPTSVTGTMAVRGQEISYQIAYRGDFFNYELTPYDLEINSYKKFDVKLYDVKTVPVRLPLYRGIRSDDDYLTKEACLLPDALWPLEERKVISQVDYWRSLWITVKIPENCPAGKHFIRIAFRDANGVIQGKKTFTVDVYPQVLPEQKLLYTQWFYCDCIADVHHVPVFSEAHWSLIASYMKLAAEGGINVILTPVLTPPLDTQIGGERPTTQLVDIVKNGDSYEFEFSKLKRYIALAQKCGMLYFEINHLFTQWGASHAPKVIATVDGEEKRIFGWETDAKGAEYQEFIRQLVPAILKVFEEEKISRERIYFHVSDEPRVQHLDYYRADSELLLPLIEGCGQIDALSDITFYNDGLVREPIPGTDHMEAFLEAKVPNVWCYYCCSQGNLVGNRFMSMPSYRNRILGVQMYKTGVKGFLHWGYNFYNNQNSVKKINPYFDTDGEGMFPSGDTFSVYPYKDGAAPSLRHKIFHDGLEDMRLLYLVEEKLGRDAVIAELDRLCGEPLTFKVYPRNNKFFEELYKFIFANL